MRRAPNGIFYNSAVVIDADGNCWTTYRKIHVPQDPLFYEQNYFQQGNLGYKVYQTAYAKIGCLICYDQWFPRSRKNPHFARSRNNLLPHRNRLH
jgi:N-carbamoylputrescine amidase